MRDWLRQLVRSAVWPLLGAALASSTAAQTGSLAQTELLAPDVVTRRADLGFGRAPAHRGFWIGFGAGPGFAALDCTRCGSLADDGPWEGGAGMYFSFALGGTPRENLLLGGEVSGWGRVDDGDDVNASLGAASFIMQYYPLRESGLFFKAGLGLGGSRLSSPFLDLDTSGFVGSATVGYDIAIGRRFAIAPHATFMQSFAEGQTVDTPGGVLAGPDSPGALLVGLGFYWY